ncbi:putative transmembrane emp24 domain-containing protein [Helianthus annuus]|nr:putative transmembrane emp24 domain-containing protein [Helianthus annuus]KAJ0760736.1 putative transmembrane emp24 domain-containing protein [Helianthus annuus]
MAASWSYRAIIALTWWCITTTITQAIWLDLPDSGTKCVSEDIHNNVVVLADYALINNGEDSHLHPSATISVKVTVDLSFFHDFDNFDANCC